MSLNSVCHHGQKTQHHNSENHLLGLWAGPETVWVEQQSLGRPQTSHFQTCKKFLSKLVDFEGWSTHVWPHADLIWAFLVGFEVCFVVCATNSNSPREGLLGFFVSVLLWSRMHELTPERTKNDPMLADRSFNILYESALITLSNR